MPVHPVRRKGKIIGYRYGRTGKIYRGKGARRKAGKQGQAIGWSKHRRK